MAPRKKEIRQRHAPLVAAWAAPESSTLETRLSTLLSSEHAPLARVVYDKVFTGLSWRELASREKCSLQQLQNDVAQFATRFLL
jgi:hypothetical protein